MFAKRGGILNALLVAGGVLTGCGDGEFEGDRIGSAGVVRQTASAYAAVPKARCGPGDRVETGLQGQTTLAERASGASMQAYNCNLERVGQFTGEGTGWQHAWFDDCAYYGTTNDPGQQHPGVAVIDVSDPRNPEATAYLNDPAMAEPWESLKVNERRKLLGAVQANNGGGTEPGFALYDISADCRHPQPLTYMHVEPAGPTAVRGHAGDFAPDGLTYYGTGAPGGGQLRAIYPIDITDPTNPKMLAKWEFMEHEHSSHDLSIRKDGTRLYAAQSFNAGFGAANGLVILDVSEAQNRVPDPQPKVISELFWEDGRGAQQPTQVRIGGRPFILFSDEAGSRGTGGAARAEACAAGLPPHGFARLIDISDEKNPVVTSLIMLEVHDPANCPLTVDDTPISFGYDAHYCTVDNPENGKLAACSFFQSGIRVFDIRDAYNPREIAYYKPPAVGGAPRPGSNLAERIPFRTADWASSNTRFVKVRGEDQLWITSQDNGFQVLRFTKPIHELLGPNPHSVKDRPGKARGRSK
jgi:hypothetical protein